MTWFSLFMEKTARFLVCTCSHYLGTLYCFQGSHGQWYQNTCLYTLLYWLCILLIKYCYPTLSNLSLVIICWDAFLVIYSLPTLKKKQISVFISWYKILSWPLKQVKWIVMMAPQLTFDLYLGKLSQHFRFSFQHFLASLIAFSLSSYFSSIFFFYWN